MKEEIQKKIDAYKDWQEEIFTNIRNAENLTVGRVCKWSEDLLKLEIKIVELQGLLSS